MEITVESQLALIEYLVVDLYIATLWWTVERMGEYR